MSYVAAGNSISSLVGWIFVLLLATLFFVLMLDRMFESKDARILKKSLPDSWKVDAVKDGYALARNQNGVISVWKIYRDKGTAEIEIIMPYIGGEAEYKIVSVGEYSDNINVYVTDGESTFLYVLENITDISGNMGEPEHVSRKRIT